MSAPRQLRRVLTLWQLVPYGLSIIIGAGIYVAIGSVIDRADGAAPLSFLLAAGAAALAGMCYAEFASRFPEAAGAAAYVERGFESRRLGQLTGLAVTLAVLIAAATIAQGAVQYLAILVPVPTPLLTVALVSIFTAVALLGVRESVTLAVLMGLVEITGLIAVTIAGFAASESFDLTRLFPSGAADWLGVVAGANIAFFAFIGFETLANMAEEAEDATRNVPRAILIAIALSATLYVAVAVAIVASGVAGKNPMLELFEGPAARVFATLGSIAVANGVLIEIIMLSRVLYGMSRRAQLPAFLGEVHPELKTPVAATLLAGVVVLLAALTLPFEHLLVSANVLTLGVFGLVALGLWRVKRRPSSAAAPPFAVWSWLPLITMTVTVCLILTELLV